MNPEVTNLKPLGLLLLLVSVTSLPGHWPSVSAFWTADKAEPRLRFVAGCEVTQMLSPRRPIREQKTIFDFLLPSIWNNKSTSDTWCLPRPLTQNIVLRRNLQNSEREIHLGPTFSCGGSSQISDSEIPKLKPSTMGLKNRKTCFS